MASFVQHYVCKFGTIFFFFWLILSNNVGSCVSIKIIGWENTLETLKSLATEMLGWLTGHSSSLVYFNVLWKKLVSFSYYD